MVENDLEILKRMFQMKVSNEVSKDFIREKEYYRNREYDSEKLILNSLLYGNAGALSVILAFLGTQAEKTNYFHSVKYSLLFLGVGLFSSFWGLIFLNSESSHRVSQYNYLNTKQNYKRSIDKISSDRQWLILAEKFNVPLGYNDEQTADAIFKLKDQINKCEQKIIKCTENANQHKRYVARSLIIAFVSFGVALVLQGISLFLWV
ncbi:MAG: hypothetical protein ABJG88_09040 [Litorimonas sp.]